MIIKLRQVKSQSIIEYATLIMIVLSAVSTMVLYIQRAMNVRFRHIREEMNESQR